VASYIAVPEPKGKVEQFARLFPRAVRLGVGSPIPLPSEMDDLDALVCVVVNDNQTFDAIAVCSDDRELARFTNPSDRRRKAWFLLPKVEAMRATGLTLVDFNRVEAVPGSDGHKLLRALRVPEFPKDPITDLDPPFKLVTDPDEIKRELGLT